jgi:RimJ/RimL family protein N-acetyltransferase
MKPGADASDETGPPPTRDPSLDFARRTPSALPVLATPRLRLEPCAPRHAADLYSSVDNWEVVRWLTGADWPQDRARFEEWTALAGELNDAAEVAVAAVLCDGRAVGVVAVNWLRGARNLGYWLGEPWWGRGLMSEAVEATLAWFFAHHDDLFILSGAVEGNAASLRILEKLGFVVVAETMTASQAHGRLVGHIDMMLGRRAWERRGAISAPAAAPDGAR